MPTLAPETDDGSLLIARAEPTGAIDEGTPFLDWGAGDGATVPGARAGLTAGVGERKGPTAPDAPRIRSVDGVGVGVDDSEAELGDADAGLAPDRTARTHRPMDARRHTATRDTRKRATTPTNWVRGVRRASVEGEFKAFLPREATNRSSRNLARKSERRGVTRVSWPRRSDRPMPRHRGAR